MASDWVASVAAASSGERSFLGYRTVGEESTPFVRADDGTWKDAVDGTPADDELAQTLEFLCEQAEEQGVDALAGTYGSSGPEITAQEEILPRSERSDSGPP